MSSEKLISDLKLKIARKQRRGEEVPEALIDALAQALNGAQNRLLRQLSNQRFGKRKAREFKKTKGYLSFRSGE